MSRLIVKNLPVYVTPARLREHFEQKGGPGGTLTDVKVSSKADGTSRRFGFVGFKSEEEARRAQEWFDRTFIDSTKIGVGFSEGAADAPRPHKRQRLDHDSNHNNTASSSKSKSNSTDPISQKEPTKKDTQREEFMKLMEKKKGPSWANEPAPVPVAAPVVVPESAPAPGAGVAGDGDEEHAKDQGTMSDIEWMRQRMSAAVDAPVVEERVFEQDEEDGGDPAQVKTVSAASEPVTVDASRPSDPTKETILQTSRLFVRNLAFSCTDEELAELFKPFGQISQIHTPRDPTTKQHKGLAYVTFAKPADALAAYDALDKRSFQGRLLHILAAVDRKGKPEAAEGEGHKKSLKDEKNLKRKAMAGQEFNWSMLYMNSDAVASSIAARMNIDKAEILNPETGDNAAVKLALAETHIIQETKAYLEAQGVLLASFSSKARSNTTILVKNIPFGTSADQITEMFAPHGELARVLVPPAGTIAVVDFARPDEAQKAFRAVAYRRLGNSIVYLEKGPLGMFAEGFVPPAKGAMAAPGSAAAVRIAEQVAGEGAGGVEGEAEDEGEPSIQGGTTLYVKNLAFSTTQERLAKVFAHLPSFAFARVQTKPDPKRPESGARLSMGYGFLGFKDADGARKAVKSVQGFMLDGHALHVSFAGRGAEGEGGKETEKEKETGKSRTTKMIVKNVPFEATKKDMRDLFGAHGHLKSVRLPKKFDSRSRGFAFLEFVSRHEAENAFNTLRHTHFLGRHLVLEWAEEAEQDIEALRKKAGVGYGAGKAMPGRKRKLDMGRDEQEDVDGLE